MLQAVRYKLHFGPYTAPHFNHGGHVTDVSRGKVKIVGVSSGRIPWPLEVTSRRSFAVIAAKAFGEGLNPAFAVVQQDRTTSPR